MSRYRFDAARPEDDAALRARMAAEWLRGALSVSFRREPSYFAGAALQGDQVQVYKCVDTQGGALVGMGARLMCSLYLNGEPRRVGLLCDLRLAAEARGGTLLARGYRVLRALHEADPVQFYLTVIMDGNQVALRALTGARAGLPVYRDLGRMLTPALHLDLPRPPLRVRGVQFRRATIADAAGLAALCAEAGPRRQFARAECRPPPGLALTDHFVAESGSRLIGCVAAWDQHAFRQTHIEAYTPALARARPFYNALARLLPLRPLPAPGARIPYVYLSGVCLRSDDLAVWRGLLRHAYRALRGGPWHFAIAALHERDPLAVVLADYRAIRAAGRIFVVHYAEDRSAVERIDGRIPYLDMARI